MQEGTLYRHILRHAWEITLRNKILWVLGFLAVFWGEVGAYHSLNSALGDFSASLPERISGSLPTFSWFHSFTKGGVAVGVGAIVVLLLCFIALLVLALAARGGLIFEIASRHKGKKISISDGLRRGFRAFWPLLLVGLLTKLDILLTFLMITPLTEGSAPPFALGLFIVAFTLVTLISLTVSFLGIYASCLIVLEGYGVVEAIRESLRLFARHWLVSLEMALLLYGLGFLVGISVLLLMAVLAVPFILLMTIVTLLHLKGLVLLVLIPAILIYMALLIVLGAGFVTFQYTAWTLLFLRLEDQPVAKIVRLTSRFGHILHRKLI